eukprot:scaffold12240_cov106-Isochrysis_galbana.AAC.1
MDPPASPGTACFHRLSVDEFHLCVAVASVLAVRACSLQGRRIGYAGCLDDPITRRRIRLPARMHGLGLRERAALAPIAYVACFVEAAEACVDG